MRCADSVFRENLRRGLVGGTNVWSPSPWHKAFFVDERELTEARLNDSRFSPSRRLHCRERPGRRGAGARTGESWA